jgi:hypothetical protein
VANKEAELCEIKSLKREGDGDATGGGRFGEGAGPCLGTMVRSWEPGKAGYPSPTVHLFDMSIQSM